MTNLEYLKTLDAKGVAQEISKVIDLNCEVRLSSKDDEHGLEIVWLDQDKFSNWLNKERD